MKKVLLGFIISSLIVFPGLAFASGIDQYGYFIDIQGRANYTFIPEYPSYYSGYLSRPALATVFYQPEVPVKDLADKTEIVFTPQLSNNPDKDFGYCQEQSIFAEGRYTMDGKIRIKPVCSGIFEKPEAKTIINQNNYYSHLPVYQSAPVSKAYPFHIYLDKKVFISRPDLEELKGRIIQGETDPAMYYVDKENGKLILRKILADKAESMWGDDYQEKIIYFSDAIIYSFQLGKSIW